MRSSDVPTREQVDTFWAPATSWEIFHEPCRRRRGLCSSARAQALFLGGFSTTSSLGEGGFQ